MTNATFLLEIECEVEGQWVPYTPATPPSYSSGGDPPDGGYCEDVCISRLRMSQRTGYNSETGKAEWTSVDILENVDTSDPNVLRLLGNILACVESEAQEALADTAGDDDDRDYEPEFDEDPNV